MLKKSKLIELTAIWIGSVTGLSLTLPNISLYLDEQSFSASQLIIGFTLLVGSIGYGIIICLTNYDDE
jgi:hypothetical protein